MIKLGSNIAALQAGRALSRSSDALGKIFERLSSGVRINRAADDAAAGVHDAGAQSRVGELPGRGPASVRTPGEQQDGDQRDVGGPGKDWPDRSGGHIRRDYGTGMPDFRAEGHLA